MNEPQISLTGNLAFDPDVRTTPNGVPVVDLRVASTRRVKDGDQWSDGETLWFDVACWNKLAENVGASLHKGDKVTITGRLLQKTWTREDGTSSVKLVIDASSVGLDLARFPVKVQKPLIPGGAAHALSDQYANKITGEQIPRDLVASAAGPLVAFDDRGLLLEDDLEGCEHEHEDDREPAA